ncbi:SDR family oxidoreductase [Brevibacillus fluminis]|uniref:SDR family oxidoreductase n=1 Tax=Brevibacillus fluminis TaxID=511487 RepID=UPI003F8ADB08
MAQTRKIAVITGATRSAGIGAAICKALAAQNTDIFFTHWRSYDASMPWGVEASEPDTLAQELIRLGVRCAHIEADLSQPDTPETIMEAVVAQLGVPSILVNNAAFSLPDTVDTIDADLLDRHYAVNVRGTILLSAAFTKRFTAGKGGRIINLTSGQSRGPMPGEIAYVASKGAVEAFTLTFSAEVARRGITVNAVNPGPTDTGWMSEETRAALGPRFPFGRIGQPEDAARLVAFLASEEAAWITGQVIHSEGGFRRV